MIRRYLVILQGDIFQVDIDKIVTSVPRHRLHLEGMTFGKLKKWVYKMDGDIYEQLPLITEDIDDQNAREFQEETKERLRRELNGSEGS